MKHDYDIIIVGAGPAGMAAAYKASENGLSVAILDEQDNAGGQIYRNVSVNSLARKKILGKDYVYGESLVSGLKNKLINHIKNAKVWKINKNASVNFSHLGKSSTITGKKLLLATGAIERPTPLPGWTLPGVMTAGAAQILLKSSGMVAKKAVLTGSGPLLYLIAAQMIRAGYPPLALVETQSIKNYISAMPYFKFSGHFWREIKKGLTLINEIKKAKVPRFTGAKDIKILGSDKCEAIEFIYKGKVKKIKADSIFLHQGIAPNIQASQSLQLDHHWNHNQKCLLPTLNQYGLSSLENIYIAGDGATIGGAIIAEYSGYLAAVDIAYRLKAINKDLFVKNTNFYIKKRKQAAAIRGLLDKLYSVPDEILTPKDSTIICRCEEVTARDILKCSQNGYVGINQIKAFSRAGMGPCQGRYCGLTVGQLLNKINKDKYDLNKYYRIRPPLKPVTIGEIADIKETKKDLKR